MSDMKIDKASHPYERRIGKHPALGASYDNTSPILGDPYAVIVDEWNKDKVIAAVRQDLLQRSEFGLKKYGQPLSDRTDIDLPGWLKHMYEELLDLVYRHAR